ncbi:MULTISPECIES: DUF6484 domain-containing protein [unclassified Mesorhizobium]|uniref:DUF6484 domain-containing protein n=1 Tax=unclassified Mesorhizobium TaxID=325217 RepID=UPI0003CFF193|nr:MULTISPECIES: DUF6484 domain-containing protein [unclassified Mesorhizobium]ESZ49672.1 hypothetical protein X730_07650 [Mesorhizobium sp. L103C565B0]ESZ73441.1 hypothetical protein X727_01215 [Mesorhizobium sp. L103C119B0]
MSKVVERIYGVVIGLFLGFDDQGPLVVFPGNPEDVALRARSLVELNQAMIGSEVALLFQDGDPRRPLIMGPIIEPARKRAAQRVISDGEYVRLKASKRIELRCGKSSLILDSDGHISLRGKYIVSHASGANNIRGGSVNLN